MGKRKEHELDIHENGKSKSPKLCGTNYPVSISFIVVNEFCERFSYYGMKAVLTLYFINYLHWDQNLSTAVYHAFSSLCYFTPVLGALIADSWLGKFRTIIYLSVVYVLGHIIKSVGAIPSVGNSTVHMSVVGSLSMLGLVLIAFGTGGIKPCVAAFGGDQFDEEHTIERRKFFSIFYMSINAGSVLSTVITPILRGDVKCFGGDCYALAFGVPAILMVIALVVFISGSGMYKKSPPEGNVLSDVCKCIGLAIKNRWRSSEFDSKKKHWLDWAEEKYPRRLIHEIKMVLRVLVLYIPLPMFWALFDQQGSRWTLQATRMNMAFVSLTMLNALLILLFVPIFDVVVYPLIGLCRINLTPLKKMAVGMILAALAFGAATLVEVNVMKTVVEPAPRGQCLLQVYNLAESDIQLDISGSNLFSQPIKSYEDPPSYQHLQLGGSSKNVSMRIIQNKNTSECVQSFREQKAYSLILHSSGSGVVCQLVISADNFHHALTKSCTHPISHRYTKVRCSSGSQVSFINLGLLDFGASYTIILTNGSVGIVPKKMVDVVANNIHITWQIPQYILITAGEVMFSITGLEFSYSQAPANMKSVLQAGWLLTVAFGNVIVLIVAEGAGLNQWMEFLLFAGLLVAVCIIFSIMAYFYKYVDPEELDKLFQDKTVDGEDDDSLKKDKKEHMEQAGDSTYLKSGIKNTAM
uniref:Solute carrier family 15 member 2 n=1 Tax=Esox lucius TaxID=8010 RepID=A0A6Q2WVR5_ESOLU